jgi:hypothetical protein
VEEVERVVLEELQVLISTSQYKLHLIKVVPGGLQQCLLRARIMMIEVVEEEV